MRYFSIAGLILFITFSGSVYAQNIPLPVTKAFQKAYPGITKVKWDKEDNNFEANFTMQNSSMSVTYDKDGNLVETETSINEADLIMGIRNYIKANYPNDKIKEAARIVDAKGVLTFEVEIKGLDVVFDANGKFLKTEKD